MDAGTRVRLERKVERYPHFVAHEGATGTVTQANDELITVEMDETIEGAHEWDNQIQWHKDMFVDENFREVFADDVEIIN